MQIDPRALLDPNMTAAGAIHLVSLSFGMVGRDPNLPAVQEFSLADLLVPEESPATGGAMDGDHWYRKMGGFCIRRYGPGSIDTCLSYREDPDLAANGRTGQ